jgi:hypothetical protein
MSYIFNLFIIVLSYEMRRTKGNNLKPETNLNRRSPNPDSSGNPAGIKATFSWLFVATIGAMKKP